MQTIKNPQQRTILCIDDDEDDRELIDSVIQELNEKYMVLKASNGEEALQLLEKQEKPPCLILLDINMPVMGGKETLKKLKSSEGYSRIPVIVFTTSSNPSDEAFFSEFGVPVHTKPDKFQTMISKVQGFLHYCED